MVQNNGCKITQYIYKICFGELEAYDYLGLYLLYFIINNKFILYIEMNSEYFLIY